MSHKRGLNRIPQGHAFALVHVGGAVRDQARKLANFLGGSLAELLAIFFGVLRYPAICRDVVVVAIAR
jgi:hypothetical protein